MVLAALALVVTLAAPIAEEVLWQPQARSNGRPGPQAALIACPCFEVLFGGARGGGKTDAILGDWIAHEDEFGAAARGLVVRREAVQLEDMIARSFEIYGRLGWEWNGSSRAWTAPTRAQLRFRPLWDEADAAKYQGHQYTRVYGEELTNWPSPHPIRMLFGTLRSAHGVRVGFRGTANPGGPGHSWVKARYIDPEPKGYRVIVDDETGLDRVFIPSRLEDNPALVAGDPKYEERLRLVGGNELFRAWRFGDWNIVAGGAIDDLWRPDRHVIAPFEIPSGWRIDRAFDWGSSKPFSVGWWAESNGESVDLGARGKLVWPKGSVVQIAELYGWNGKPNEGSRKTAAEIAREVLAAEKAMGLAHRVQPGPADPAIYAVENGSSIADDMARAGVKWIAAETGPGSRANGLERMRGRLKAALATPMEEPGLFFFDTCRHSLRTLPVLPRDQRKPDDVDTSAEDHAYDMVRYRAMRGGPSASVTKRPW